MLHTVYRGLFDMHQIYGIGQSVYQGILSPLRRGLRMVCGAVQTAWPRALSNLCGILSGLCHGVQKTCSLIHGSPKNKKMKTKDYTKDTNGLQKMRSLLTNTHVLMMATNLGKIPFSACPMTLQDMDKNGGLWFFTPRDSDHFKDIETDNRVQLLAVNEQEQTYLSIYGNATHIVDDSKVDELWNPMLKAWFTGKKDTNLGLLNINMESAYYWNYGENRMVSLHPLSHITAAGNLTVTEEKGHINLQNH